MPEQENLTDDVGPALRSAADAFVPDDRAALVGAGITDGRRRAARRRRATVTAGAALVAALGAGGAWSAGLLGGSSASLAAKPARPAAPLSTADQRIDSVLRRLVPAGSLTGARYSDRVGPAESTVAASWVFDDGRGPAALSVSVRKGGGTGEDVACPDKGLAGYDSCRTVSVPQDGRAMVMRGYEFPDRRLPTKLWSATLLTRDGDLVEVQEWNAPEEKGAAVSRAEPPLSEARLTSMLDPGNWTPALAALPVPPHPAPSAPPPRTSLPHGTTLRATLASLLPKGVEVTGRDTSDDGGYTYLLIDDGRGVTRLEINVQPGMGDVEGELFSGATRLPDGTELATHKDAGEKGGVGMELWWADTLRPDGLRVVVMESNGSAQSGPATRRHPLLDMDRLSAIATSGKWRDYVGKGAADAGATAP